MKLGIQESEPDLEIPNEVCSACYNEFTQMVSHGAKLRAERQAKEHNRMMLWKNRVDLIKHARVCLAQKSLSEAAMSYEKYLKILEVVYDLKDGLNPDIFRDKARQKELTLISSVYWDLVCIYDLNSRYKDRQIKAAEQLLKFAPLTPVFGDILKKARHLTKSGKNKALFKKILKKGGKEKSGCFIVTSAFESSNCYEVIILSQFRDQKLNKNWLGKKLIKIYYTLSPYLVILLNHFSFLKPIVRLFIRIVIKMPIVRNEL